MWSSISNKFNIKGWNRKTNLWDQYIKQQENKHQAQFPIQAILKEEIEKKKKKKIRFRMMKLEQKKKNTTQNIITVNSVMWVSLQ